MKTVQKESVRLQVNILIRCPTSGEIKHFEFTVFDYTFYIDDSLEQGLLLVIHEG